MNYSAEYSEHILRIFDRMAKREISQLASINKKINEILASPHHFKPLKGDMKGSRRVHFGHFVMTFEIDEERTIVRFLDYEHHDKVY